MVTVAMTVPILVRMILLMRRYSQGLHFHRQVLDVLLGGERYPGLVADSITVHDALGLPFGKLAADKLLERIMRVDR